jgi:peptidoglycan/LPS O-acetylase OafA/YrhL
MSQNKKISIISEFEGLRGILALWVVIGHWATTISFSLYPLHHDLWNVQAVDVFIILSGFVITMSLCTSNESYTQYLTRRWFRIFPAFFVVLLISLAMLPYIADILQSAPPSEMKEVRLAIIGDSKSNFFLNIFSHLTLLHGLIPLQITPYSAYTFVGQAWSISLEWQFYVLAPLFFFLIRNIYRPILALTFFTIIFILSISGEYFSPAYLGNKLHLFAVGAVSFYIWMRMIKNNKWTKLKTMRMVTIITVLLLLLLREKSLIGLAVWMVVFYVVLAVRHPESKGRRAENILAEVMRSRFILFLGHISYTLYLVHFMVMIAVMAMLEQFSLSPAYFAIALFALLLPLSIAAACLLSKYIEQPFMRLGRNLSQGLLARNYTLYSRM